MELHHVRDFVAVAEELSFTRAADKLHVAQPSLTRKIRNLEEEIGVSLFDRGKGRLVLTEAGRAFLTAAKRLLALSAESIETARRVGRGEVERFRIGYTAGFDYHRLPATLAAFHRVCPAVKLSLFDMTCAEQMRGLEHYEIDLGFVGIPDALQGSGLQSACVGNYELLAALPAASDLARKTAIAIEDLEDVPFIALSLKEYPRYDEWMRRVSPAAFRPRRVQTAERFSVMLNSVAAGLGVALMHRAKPPSAPRRRGVPPPQTPAAGGVVRGLAARRPIPGAARVSADFKGVAATAGRFQRTAGEGLISFRRIALRRSSTSRAAHRAPAQR